MYKCVTFLPLFCFFLHIEWKKNDYIFTTFFFESEWGSHSHMNHAQEKTGMEVKGKSDKLLALDGTERTEKKHAQRTVELHTVNDG